MEIFGYGRVDRRQLSHYLRTGIILPPEAQEEAPVERKYNHYHNPENGEFAPRGMGVPDRASGGGSRDKAPTGAFLRDADLFKSLISKPGDAGIVAQAMNRLMVEPGSKIELPLGVAHLTIRRQEGRRIKMKIADGVLSAQGEFARTPGLMEVVFTIEKPVLSPFLLGAELVSFPTRMAVRQISGGRLVYTRNAPIQISRNGKLTVDYPAGIFFVSEKADATAKGRRRK